MQQLIVSTNLKHTIILLIGLIYFAPVIKAQCPVGETEILIGFDTSYLLYADAALWSYSVNGEPSGAGPFSFADTLIACVPNGELTITGCGNWMDWSQVPIEVKIIDDGSINGCTSETGCELFYEPYDLYSGGFNVSKCQEGIPFSNIISFEMGCDSSNTADYGCTNINAPNYSPCAVIDDGSCQLMARNNTCETAVPITINNCEGKTVVNNIYNNSSGLIPSCEYWFQDFGTDPPIDLFYEVVVPPSGNFSISTTDAISVTIYDTCMGMELYCESESTDFTLLGLNPGETIILQVWQNFPSFYELCLEEIPVATANDLCEQATPLCGELLFDNNENAFGGDSDPDFDCAGYDKANSVWYSFVADDSGLPVQVIINIESCISNYSDLPYYFYNGINSAVFSGVCDNLVEEDCSSLVAPTLPYEDDASQFAHVLSIDAPVPGETYYVYVSSNDFTQYCNYNIATSTGIESCCGLDIILNPVCPSEDAEEFYLELDVFDLGSNPSGYVINGGEFEDVTEVTTASGFTIGPFPIGIATITVDGKDDPNCSLTYKIKKDCAVILGNTCDMPAPLTLSEYGDCNYSFVSNEGNSFSGLMPSCIDGYYVIDGQDIGADNFFTFEVPALGSFNVAVESTNDISIAVYNACDNTELACDFYIGKSNLTGFEPGETLLLQLLQNSSMPYSICIEEVPEAPENDVCENAIPLCGTQIWANTNAATISENDPSNSCGYELEQNIWYTFDTNSSAEPVTVYLNTLCNFDGITAGIYQGNCEDGFEEVDCDYSYSYYSEDQNLELVLENPEPDATYYLLISSSQMANCLIEINTSFGGIDLCCGMDFTIEEQCNPDDTDSFFINFNVNDFGESPSGFTVNYGNRDRVEITTLGDNIIGPYYNGVNYLLIEGIDSAGCWFNPVVEFSCAPPPSNDFCEDAIELNCKGVYAGTMLNTTTSNTDVNCNEQEVDNSVWFKFTMPGPPTDSLQTLPYVGINVNVDNFVGNEQRNVTILSGDCGGPFTIENCVDFSGEVEIDFNEFQTATEGETYYIQLSSVSGFAAEYILAVTSGLEQCASPEVNLTANCSEENSNEFFVDIEITDFAGNPSGYIVNDGAFPNITETGTTTIGPFEIGTQTIILEGLDLFNFIYPLTVTHYCECDEIEVINDELDYTMVAPGESVVLFDEGIFVGYCDSVKWVTDIDNPDETVLATGEFFQFNPDSATTIYSITNCLNCQQYLQTHQIDVFDECDESIVEQASSTLLSDEPSVSYPINLNIQLADANNCDFLYWVNTPRDPEETLISTNENHEFNVPWGVDYDVYGVVSCNDGSQCVQPVQITTPNTPPDIPDSLGLELCLELELPFIATGGLVSSTPNENNEYLSYLSQPMPDSINCNFLYWEDLDGDILSTEPEFEFLLAGGVTFTAIAHTECYDFPCPASAWVVIETPNTPTDSTDLSGLELCEELELPFTATGGLVSSTPNENNEYLSYLLQPIPDTINCNFLYWKNLDGDIISTEPEFEFLLPSGVTFTATAHTTCYDFLCPASAWVIIETPPCDTPDCEDDDPGGPTDGNDEQAILNRQISIASPFVCNGDQPNITIADGQLEAGKSLYYLFHNNADLSVNGYGDATDTYALSFENVALSAADLPCGSSLYVTAFIDDAVANLADIDLTRQSIAFSNTVGFTYLCTSEINVVEKCNNNGTYDLSVAITGGLPQVDNSATYTVVGDVYSGNIYNNQNFIISTLPDGSNFNLEVVDDANCSTSVTGSIQCDKLPVELLTFEGEAQPEGNLLKWSTATEINNDYFIIEGSRDGINFIKVGTVKGSGNSSETQPYQFLDRQTNAGLTYYRLKQTDFDGTTTVKANTEVLRGESSTITLINAYPIPFLDELNLQLHNNLESKVEINLIDVLGKEVISKQFELQKGLNEIILSTTQLPKGLYLIAIDDKEGVYYQKIIKE